jgi:ion channel POLLUX/CASTOR
MAKFSFSDKFRYWFDNTLSRGTVAIILWLGVVSAIMISIFAVILAVTGLNSPDSESMGFLEAAWQSLMRTLDAGNMADDSGWIFRGIMLLVTIGGIFIVATLIGTVTSGLEAKLDELRKGRSRVVETGHTLILGWSPKIFSIISELLIANESASRPRIVILAENDKVEMEDEIRSRFPKTGNTKIICRSGSPLDLNELEVASPHDAKSIVILSPEAENPDTHVIKAILAITNNPNRRSDKYHIIAEIRDEANMEAAELVGGDEAVLVLAGDLIARVTAQTCRQSGLSVVYTELLDFDGAEIYFAGEDSLTGKTYKEAIFGYEESALMGIFKSDGSVLINPSMDTKIEKGDQMIAISEDDSTLVYSPKKETNIKKDTFVTGTPSTSPQEKTLVLGWNNKGQTIIKELANYVQAGSEMLVVAETDDAKEQAEALAKELTKVKIVYRHGDTTLRSTLNELNVDKFDHIIILCYTGMDVQESDAKTLITLLHLRSMADQDKKKFSIVSEMLDIRNRELAAVTRANDFIVSDKLISLMLSQLSQNKHLKKVFDVLFSEEGSEIYLKPATDYIREGAEVNFYTVLESAAIRGETAIGYKLERFSSHADKGYGVAVNPVKSKEVKFTKEDKIIVLAEN